MEQNPQNRSFKKILWVAVALLAVAAVALFAQKSLEREDASLSRPEAELDQNITSSSGQEIEETQEKTQDIMPDSSEYRATEPSEEEDASQDPTRPSFVDARMGIAFSFPDSDSVKRCTPQLCGEMSPDTYFISSPDGSRTYLGVKAKDENISLEKYLAQEYKFDGLLLESRQNGQGTQIVRPAKKQSDRYYAEFGELGSGIEYHHFIAAGKKWIAYVFHDQSHGSNPQTVKMVEDTISLK